MYRGLEHLILLQTVQIEPMFVHNVTPDPFNYLVIKKGSDSKLVDGFSKAIKQLQDSGKWDQIYKKYTE